MNTLQITEVELTQKGLRYYQGGKMLTKKQVNRYRKNYNNLMQESLEKNLQKAIESGNIFAK